MSMSGQVFRSRLRPRLETRKGVRGRQRDRGTQARSVNAARSIERRGNRGTLRVSQTAAIVASQKRAGCFAVPRVCQSRACGTCEQLTVTAFLTCILRFVNRSWVESWSICTWRR